MTKTHKTIFTLFLILIFRESSSIKFDGFGEESIEAFFSRPIEDSEPFREVLLVDENDSSDDGTIAEETVVVENFDPFRQQYGAVFGDNQREVEEMWSDEEEKEEGEEEEEEDEEGRDGSTSTKEELVWVEAQSEEEEKGEDGKCAKGWLNFQDKACFYGLRTQRQFYAGVEECGHLRANFTSIQSVEEYKFISSHWNLKDFWIGIFNGKSHYEDGTPVDPEVFRQISPLIPWSTPDVLKGFICRKNPIVGDEPARGSSEEMDMTKDDEALEERVKDDKALEAIAGDGKSELSATSENVAVGDKPIVDDGNNPTISLIETTKSETLIELNKPTNSETLIESNKTTNSETLIELNKSAINKRPISKRLIVAKLLIVDENPRSPAGTSSSPFPSLIARTLLCLFLSVIFCPYLTINIQI